MKTLTFALAALAAFAILLMLETKLVIVLFCWTAWKIDDMIASSTQRNEKQAIFAISSWTKDAVFDLYYRSYGDYNKNGKRLESTPVASFPANEKFTHDTFAQMTNQFRTPLVIRQLFAQSTSVSEWNHDYLQSTIGAIETNFLLRDANTFEFEFDVLLPREKRPQRTTYGHILEAMKHDAQSKYYISGDAEILANHDGLYRDLQLEQCLGEDLMVSCEYSRDKLYLFVGNTNTGTAWHSAPNQSLFAMMVGAKRWQFVDPKYSIYMKPERSSIFERLLFAENKEIKSNYYNYVPRLEVTLRPGDALFVPPYWWHAVDNVDTNSDNLNVGVDIDTELSNLDWLRWMIP